MSLVRFLSLSGDVVLEAQTAPGEKLSEVIRESGFALPMPCGGHGLCGKCLVSVRDDQHSSLPTTGFEQRLACQCQITGDCEVVLPSEAGTISTADYANTTALRYDGTDSHALGIAVDIGTTTISMLLFRFDNPMPLSEVHELNSQSVFGADVISRIDYAVSHGHNILHEKIIYQLENMMRQAFSEAGVTQESLTRLVITGNTTMLHFLVGLDPAGIGVAPFTPQSLFGCTYRADTLFPTLPLDAEVYIPPCISAYVGADISCGILSSGICGPGRAGLLVDVGTNGEMALYADGRILCCATAAGPAFEGAGIAMGMAALPGAIDRLTSSGDDIVCSVIGSVPPVGICGSGLISAVDLLLRLRVVDGSGRLLADGHAFTAHINEQNGQPIFWLAKDKVYLSQQDIRNVQLAKAAIAAGIQTLLHESGTAQQKLDALFLAGGFGSYLDPSAAAGIGLLPTALLGKTSAAGNTALQGAIRLLFSAEERKKNEQLLTAAHEISLSSSPYFMDQYIENMPFYEE